MRRLKTTGLVALIGVVLPAVVWLAYETKTRIHDRVVSPREALEAMGIDPRTVDLDTLSPQVARRAGLQSLLPATEILVVFISSSTCIANDFPGFREAIGRIRGHLRRQFDDQPTVVERLVGISMDASARAGAEYLFGLADFDEVVAGGGAINAGTEKYVHGMHSLGSGIPKLALVRRTMTWTRDSIIIGAEKIVGVMDDAAQIVGWVDQGAPVRLARPDDGGR